MQSLTTLPAAPSAPSTNLTYLPRKRRAYSAGMFTGAKAKVEFYKYLSMAVAAGALGAAFGYRGLALEVGATPSQPLARIEQPESFDPAEFSIVLVDGVSPDGSAFKYVWHPQTEVGTVHFAPQLPRRVG